jgi:hypothetical protein
VSLHQVELTGGINTDPTIIRDQIYANIRRQLPQAKPHALNGQEVAIVGGGPSLLSTFDELRELAFRGVKLVALNNAAAWLLERNLRPSMHILLDARASNARFITPPIPQCKYFVASQCHPDLFDAVDGRDVTIWHAVSEEDEPVLKDWYDGYYHIGGRDDGGAPGLGPAPDVRVLSDAPVRGGLVRLAGRTPRLPAARK